MGDLDEQTHRHQLGASGGEVRLRIGCTLHDHDMPADRDGRAGVRRYALYPVGLFGAADELP